MTRIGGLCFRCDICGTCYTCEAEARFCELRGICLPRFVSGDVVRLNPDVSTRLGLADSRVLVDVRRFDASREPGHDFALAGCGVSYRVRVRGGQQQIVMASAVLLVPGDLIFCRGWDEFLRVADTGRQQDCEGSDALRQMLNRRLNLGL